MFWNLDEPVSFMHGFYFHFIVRLKFSRKETPKKQNHTQFLGIEKLEQNLRFPLA